MAHPIVHIELSANSHEAAANWYAGMFGWTTQAFPEMNYTTFRSGENAVGGGFNPVQADYPAGTVVVYIETDDLEGHMAKIAGNGGTVVMPRQDIPGVGSIGMFKDPTGNLMALIQPVEMEQDG